MLIHIVATYTYHIYTNNNTVERNAILDAFCKKPALSHIKLPVNHLHFANNFIMNM